MSLRRLSLFVSNLFSIPAKSGVGVIAPLTHMLPKPLATMGYLFTNPRILAFEYFLIVKTAIEKIRTKQKLQMYFNDNQLPNKINRRNQV